MPYKFTNIEISKNVQKEPWFLQINPNGRIPALTDTFEDEKTINLFESGSIQQYLVEQYDKDYKISYPRGTREYYEMNNWVREVETYFDQLELTSSSCSSLTLGWDLCRDKRTISHVMLQSTLNTESIATKMKLAVCMESSIPNLRSPPPAT